MLKSYSLKVFNLPLNTCLSTHFSLKGFFSFDLPPKTDFKLVTFFMFHPLLSPRLSEYKLFLRWREKEMENPYPIKLTHLKLKFYRIYWWGCHYNQMHQDPPCFSTFLSSPSQVRSPRVKTKRTWADTKTTWATTTTPPQMALGSVIPFRKPLGVLMMLCTIWLTSKAIRGR